MVLLMGSPLEEQRDTLKVLVLVLLMVYLTEFVLEVPKVHWMVHLMGLLTGSVLDVLKDILKVLGMVHWMVQMMGFVSKVLKVS